MGRKKENTGFICENCGRKVLPLNNGSYRNHCPYCLYSKHVDEIPGDRRNLCQGLLKPIALKYHSKKGMQIVHKCLKCGEVRVNKVAEGTKQPDNINAILELQAL